MNRKGDFRNTENITISEGDWVVVESISGYDIGQDNFSWRDCKSPNKKKKIDTSKTLLKKIYRLAKDTDIEKFESSLRWNPQH